MLNTDSRSRSAVGRISREEGEARCGTSRQMATNKTCNRKDRKGSAKVAKKDFRLGTRNFLNWPLIFFAYLAALLRDLRC